MRVLAVVHGQSQFSLPNAGGGAVEGHHLSNQSLFCVDFKNI